MARPSQKPRTPRIEADGDYIGVRSRLFVVDERIRRGNFPSQADLAKLCGVSGKTIQRDLQYLRDSMGAPLEYDESEKGWFYTDDSFFLPSQFATAEDVEALLVVGEVVSQYQGTPLGDKMQAAFERVIGLFKNEDAERIRHLTRKVCFARLPAAPIDHEVWKAILQALQEEQRLELDYARGGREPVKAHRFEPYGLIVRDRDWFLYGNDLGRKQPITLSVPFIRRARLLDEGFDVPKGFDLKAYVKAGFQSLQADGKPVHTVVLRFAPEVADVVALRPLAHEQAVKREKSGHLTVTFKASALFQVEREVLSWGAKVEVLEPPELRARLADTVSALERSYRRSP